MPESEHGAYSYRLDPADRREPSAEVAERSPERVGPERVDLIWDMDLNARIDHLRTHHGFMDLRNVDTYRDTLRAHNAAHRRKSTIAHYHDQSNAQKAWACDVRNEAYREASRSMIPLIE